MQLNVASDFLGKVVRLGPKGQEARNKMIRSATEIGTRQSQVALLTGSNRLNHALVCDDRDEKLRRLSDTNQSEIQAFANMNGLCSGIYGAANALIHWSTNEWTDVSLGGHAGMFSLPRLEGQDPT